jgi:hypothetical protein
MDSAMDESGSLPMSFGRDDLDDGRLAFLAPMESSMLLRMPVTTTSWMSSPA